MAQVGELFGVFVNGFKAHREMRLGAEAADRAKALARKQRERARDREHWGESADRIINYIGYSLGWLLLIAFVGHFFLWR